jgi:hypothetical protein
MLDLLLHNSWLTIIVWDMLYISDYYLTLYGATLYQQYAKEHIVFEGSYELTPYYQQDINSLRRFSPRFVAALILYSGLLWVVGDLLTRLGGLPQLFVMVIGALVLLELAIHMRHIRNIALFRLIKNGAGLRGKLEYPRRVTLSMSVTEMITFAVFFFLLYLAVQNWFFLGGVISCLMTAVKHWRLSKKVGRT